MSFRNNTGSISTAKNRAQKFFGIRRTYWFSNPESASCKVFNTPRVDSDSRLSERTEYRSHNSTALQASWYMLEVRGSAKTIGANLTVSGLSPVELGDTWSDIANIQLGSHSESKRLIRLQEEVAEIRILLDGVYALEHAPVPTFVRVTAAFAVNRMCKKLLYGSVLDSSQAALVKRCQKDASEEEIASVYEYYRSLMERHVTPPAYSQWLENRSRSNLGGAEQNGLVNPGRSAITAIGHGISDFDETVLVNTLAEHDSGYERQLVDVATGAADRNTVSPSLSIFLVNADDTEGASLLGRNIAKALTRLIEHVYCDIRVIMPSSVDDYDLQRLVDNNVSNLELVYYSTGMDSTELDEWFLLQLSEIQIFIEGDARVDPLCLLTFWELFRQRPELGLCFSDNDCIDEFGRRSFPVFKPEWNPELLLNGNYIGSVAVLSRQIVMAVGGWKHRYGNSAMYEMLLRSGDHLLPDAVARIPDVLWHQITDDSAPPAALDTGFRDALVLHDYFAALSSPGVAGNAPNFSITDGLLRGSLRVDRTVTARNVSVDILIPSKDKVELLSACVQSILEKTDYANYVITIIDNDSTDIDTAAYYAEITANPAVRVMEHAGEFNFSAMNNAAVQRSSADVVVLLNNDTEVISPSWLRELVCHAIRPSVGCVGAKLYYSNGCVQHGGVIVGLKGMAGHAHRFFHGDADGYCGRLKLSQNVSAVTAACLAVRRSVYLDVGGLDEVNLKVAYNDVDFCLRVAQAGYRNIWTPYAELYHHESVSRGSDDTPAKRKRFLSEFSYMKNRWQTDQCQDPAYNPNLARDLEDFSLSITRHTVGEQA